MLVKHHLIIAAGISGYSAVRNLGVVSEAALRASNDA
jgi:hypothetical protein